MSPDSFKHDEETFQVPTTLPPHGVTLLQLAPVLDPPVVEPAVVLEPAVLAEPPVLLPAVPPPVTCELQPTPTAKATPTDTPKKPR
jgi:hypothetical protein